MGFFILTSLFLLVGLVVFFGGKLAYADAASVAERTGRSNDSIANYIAWGGLALTVVLILLVTVFKSFHTVENGHIGIVKQFGSIVGTTGEGLVTTAPWQNLDEVSVRNEIRTYIMDERQEGGTGSAVSSDSQAVFLTVQVNYSLVRSGAVELYRETGGQYVERILDPAVYQITKEVTARFKAIDFAANREVIRREIQDQLQEETGDSILINNVSLKNVDFTEALSAAIEQTVEAEQQAKRAEAQVKIKEAEARQAVAVAEGEAQSTLTKARAEAESIRVQGRALQENPEVLRLRAIEKLNPLVKVIVPQNSDLILGDSFLRESSGK